MRRDRAPMRPRSRLARSLVAFFIQAALSRPTCACAYGSEIPTARATPVALPSHRSLADDVTGDFRAMGSRRTLLTLAAGGALTAVALRLDDPGRMEVLLDRRPFDVPSDAGNRYGDSSTLAAGALGMFAAGALTGQDNLRLAGWDLTRSLVYSSAAVWAIKIAVSRTRPNGGAYSFPSGHAATAFAAAPVLASHFGVRAAIPAFALAASAAFGRMEDRKHYLSDVVLGSTIGLAVGTSVVRSSAGRSDLKFGITPDGVACTLRF